MFLKYIKSGEAMYQVFSWYLEQLKKVFNVLDSVEILPNFTFLNMLVTLLFVGLFFDVLRFGLNRFTFTKDILPDSNYVGKHSEEYLAEHTKTGKAVKTKVVQMTGKHVKK